MKLPAFLHRWASAIVGFCCKPTDDMGPTFQPKRFASAELSHLHESVARNGRAAAGLLRRVAQSTTSQNIKELAVHLYEALEADAHFIEHRFLFKEHRMGTEATIINRLRSDKQKLTADKADLARQLAVAQANARDADDLTAEQAAQAEFDAEDAAKTP